MTASDMISAQTRGAAHVSTTLAIGGAGARSIVRSHARFVGCGRLPRKAPVDVGRKLSHPHVGSAGASNEAWEPVWEAPHNPPVMVLLWASYGHEKLTSKL